MARPRKLSKDDIHKIKLEHDALIPLDVLAKRWGVSVATIVRSVRRSEPKFHRRKYLTPQQKADLTADLTTGMSYRGIAKKHGLPYLTVWRFANKSDNN